MSKGTPPGGSGRSAEASTRDAPAERGERLRALDGLRGIAAVIVVLGHSRLILTENHSMPWLGLPGVSQLNQFLGITGMTAVWLFFVLSGFVLAKTFNGNRPDYGQYVIRRMVRLYLPVWGALAFALVSMLIISRSGDGLGAWMSAHPATITLEGVVADATLLTGNWGYVTPLWSLRWEVFFSLLLILYVKVSDRIHPAVVFAVCVAVSSVGGATGNAFLLYMPMFGIGVAFAAAWDRLTLARDAFEERFTPRMRGTIAALILLALIVLQFSNQIVGRLPLPGQLLDGAVVAGRLLSVSGIVLLVALSRHIGRAFTWRPILWLGTVSFSLYLTHETVLLGFAYPTAGNPLAIVVAVVVCFPVAALFYRFVEAPAHRLSRRVGARST